MKINFIEGQHPYTPFGEGQAAVWADTTARNIFVEGGWGSGKSHVAGRVLTKNHLYNAIDVDPVTGKVTLTGIASATIAPTFSLAGSINIPYIIEAFAEYGIEAIFKKAWGGYINVIHIPVLSTKAKPSLIYVATADAPERITGWSASTIWNDEVTRWLGIGSANPKQDPLLQSKGRLRGAGAKRQLAINTYTPETSGHPVVIEAQKEEVGKAVYRLKSKDNPAVAEMEASLRATLTPEQAAQYLDGIAMDVSSTKVYYGFDRDTHVTPEAKLDYTSPNPIAISWDFNVSPGAHGYFFQYHPELGSSAGGATGEFHVAHEIFFKGLDLPTAADKAMELLKALQPAAAPGDANPTPWRHAAPLEIFGDPAGSARSLATGESCHQILRIAAEKAGIPYRMRIKAAHDPVVDRLASMNAAFKDGHSTPRLFINPQCRRLIADLEKMVYGEDGKPDKSNLDLSHASDSLGYGVSYLRPVRVSRSAAQHRVSTSLPGVQRQADGRPGPTPETYHAPRVGALAGGAAAYGGGGWG